jgi:beta-N-acetylhexosaminidase
LNPSRSASPSRPADLGALARGIMCVGFPGARVADIPLAELREFAPGGLILFARNVGAAGDVRASIAALRTCGDIAPLIAIDQEGGRVARIIDPTLVAQLPPAMALAAGGDAASCERAGTLLGRDLARLGVSVDFAPCADLALDARNTVIGTRSFGDVPAAVAARCAAFARGLENGGVAAALKHFPGHGATSIDSHLALPRVNVDAATLRNRDLVPFARAIAAGAASIVMTAHIVLEALDPIAPATLSAPVLTGLLRDELGFGGVIATDCLEMDAIAATIGTSAGAVRALAAGADLLLMSHRLDRARAAVDAIVAAVEGGEVPLARLQSAAARVRGLRERYAVLRPFAGELDLDLPQRAAQRAVTLVRGDVRLRPGKPVSVISFEGTIADGAAGARPASPSLSAALRARRQKSELMRVALEPDPADVDVLLAHLPALGDRNFVLVIRRAHLYPAQRAAVERIIERVPDAILVSAREPYDAALFAGARNVACIYGDEELSLEGCADVLAARAPAGGSLPVHIDRNPAVR